MVPGHGTLCDYVLFLLARVAVTPVVPGHGTLCDYVLFLLARVAVLWYLDTGHCVIMFYFYLPGLLFCGTWTRDTV